jgi:simple sugar transport system ATP-binding protein
VSLRDRRRAALEGVDLECAGEVMGVAGVAATASSSCTRWRWAAPADVGTVSRRQVDEGQPGQCTGRRCSRCRRTRCATRWCRDVRAQPRRPRRARPGAQTAGHRLGQVRQPTGSATRRAAAPVDGERTLGSLSSGNIQQVMLVRTIAGAAKLVVAAYPSRGLDIATTRRTQELLLERRRRGRRVADQRGPRRAVRTCPTGWR